MNPCVRIGAHVLTYRLKVPTWGKAENLGGGDLKGLSPQAGCRAGAGTFSHRLGRIEVSVLRVKGCSLVSLMWLWHRLVTTV